jgi:hypothetical protein
MASAAVLKVVERIGVSTEPEWPGADGARDAALRVLLDGIATALDAADPGAAYALLQGWIAELRRAEPATDPLLLPAHWAQELMTAVAHFHPMLVQSVHQPASR